MRISTSGPSMHSVPQRASAPPKGAEKLNESPIEQTLFGTVRPKPLDIAQFPQLAERMRWLNKQKMRIAALFGDHESDYDIQLCEGMNACVDPEGRIFIGERLMSADPALLAGVLAHEIGHRPKGWKKLKQGHGLDRKALAQLAREEEGKADYAAGRALAALDMSPDPLCNFLLLNGHFEKQPENYYDVATRIAIIKDAHQSQKTRRDAAKSLFPGFASATDVKNLIQDDRSKPPPKKRRRLGRSV